MARPAYDLTARRLHWWTAILVLTSGPLGLCQATVPDEAMADALLRAHLTLGLVIIGLTLVRVVHSVVVPRPPLPASVTGRRRTGAVVVHRTLIGLLLVIAITGLAVWITSDLPLTPWSASREAIDRASAAALAHRFLAYLFSVLAVVHIVGVIAHDALHPGTIGRMKRERSTPEPGLTESEPVA
ncbi:MAG: cytochrome b/b6 domain-containing protein [Actinomycetota bacterium]